MPLRYLGVGLSRTGTTSLHEAMRYLGFRSVHWEPQRLTEVVLGRDDNPDFRRYDDCDCIFDIPHAYFYREIGEAYPGLKYILTVRDEEAWYRSMCKHYASLPDRFSREDRRRAAAIQRIIYGSGTFPSKEGFYRLPAFLYKKRFRDWNESVRLSVPQERLLVINVCQGEGWEKLCPFVGKPIPDVPFPHSNPTAEDKSGVEGRAWEILRRKLGGLRFWL
jgi:hypothetical protein